ncbi:dirigent protein 1-like [Zingiber officinale]|uniref:dirigent protein 1-like n=1 Tax=Zingiber officinale TaxID=94328 RepID=UPI001C4BFF04|nr:dirigent protein 1-like [Zingiber officinale]
MANYTATPFTLLLRLLTTLVASFFLFLSPSSAALHAEAKHKAVTHKLHFFFHDVVSGRNATVAQIINPVKSPPTSTFLGMTNIMDDLLTEGPQPTSRPVGRAQGIYASSDFTEIAFLQIMNLVFTDGAYNGSSLTVVGRNPPLHDVREMPVVGGTGLFRFARGYAQAHTHTLSANGDAIVEYNVYVMVP